MGVKKDKYLVHFTLKFLKWMDFEIIIANRDVFQWKIKLKPWEKQLLRNIILSYLVFLIVWSWIVDFFDSK